MNTNDINGILSRETVTVILAAQGGAGKDTYAKMLKHDLEQIPKGKKVVICETGQLFRDWLKEGVPPAQKERLTAQQAAGKFQPFSLALMHVLPFLMNNASGDEHLIIDGSPRTIGETPPLMDFLTNALEREPIMIHIKISDETARKRIHARNEELKAAGKPIRMELTTEEAITTRLATYQEHVLPALKLIPKKYLIAVDGEQDKETVYGEIKKQIAYILDRRNLIRSKNKEVQLIS